MLRFAEHVAVVLWVGGLWTVGYLVAPTLFATIESRALAGVVAGRLFALIAWVGFACGGFLMVSAGLRGGLNELRRPLALLVLAMLALGLIGHFAVQPLLADLKLQAQPLEVMASPLASRFALWHGVSALLHGLQSLLGLALLAAWRRA